VSILPFPLWSFRIRGRAVQVVAFAAVALYEAVYIGEAKLAASVLYAVVGALTAVWAVSFGVLLFSMERKFARTFFSTLTGRNFVMNRFLDNPSDDELRAQIFYNNQELWRPIRGQVQAWLRSRYPAWREETPAWFTPVLIASIPTDMLPTRLARRLSKLAGGAPRTTIHDRGASLARRLSSLSPAIAQNQVAAAPEGTAAAAASRTDSESSDSESESADSEAETQLQHEAGAAGDSAA
jgi:hypothetical protein